MKTIIQRTNFPIAWGLGFTIMRGTDQEHKYTWLIFIDLIFFFILLEIK
jgi:hypothetical protein